MQIPAPIVAEAQLRVIKRELYVRCELLLHLPDKRSLVSIHAHPVHAQSLFLKLFEGGEERLRIVGRVGQDQTAVFFASDRERAVARELCRVHGRAAVFLFGQEAVDGEDVVVDVRLGEQLCRNACGHRGAERTHPFRLAVVEDRGVGAVDGTLKEMRDVVSVPHQGRERFKLRVHTASTEMRRAIGIRERR